MNAKKYKNKETEHKNKCENVSFCFWNNHFKNGFADSLNLEFLQRATSEKIVKTYAHCKRFWKEAS